MTDTTEDQDVVLRRFRDRLHREYGIHFEDQKLYSLRNKLRRRVRNLSLDDLDSYEDYLENNPDEISHLLNEVSTNKSEFFREIKHWDYITEHIVEDWKRSNETVKLWSAACSTGEEPYTASMLLYELGVKDFRILGTDIAPRALERAARGVYTDTELRGVHEFDLKYFRKYFNRDAEGTFRIKEDLQERVTLRKFNLTESHYPYKETFNLVFCRNVLIYFDDDTIEHVINELSDVLKPGGYLFVGHTETLQSINHPLEKIQPSIFRKRR